MAVVPVLVSVPPIVPSAAAATFAPCGVWLFSVSNVDEVGPATLPAACSPVAGTAAFSESSPCPSADQALAPAVAVNVQVKSVDAPTASVVAPPVKEAHFPPPLTLTACNGSL